MSSYIWEHGKTALPGNSVIEWDQHERALHNVTSNG